jgi:Kef-type K+ transport system membrane component KefB/voltage-gated potassium channel Kch
MNNLLLYLIYIIPISSLIAIIFYFLKLPIVLSYIGSGFILSYFFILDKNFLENLGKLGVILLLFLVGLRLDWSKLKTFSKNILTISILHLLFSSISFFTLLYFLTNLNLLEIIILSIILSFNSTIFVIKILIEKNEIDSLVGRNVLSILLIQDIISISLIILLPLINNQPENIYFIEYKLLGIVFLTFVFFIGQYVSKIIDKFRKNSELIFLLSFTWLLLFVYISNIFRISYEIGALLAGISLSNSKFLIEISRRFSIIKDLFLIFYFSYLGSIININNSSYKIFIYILFLKIFFLPLLLFYLMNYFKYSKRTSFSSAIYLTQFSEFLIILGGIFLTQYLPILSLLLLSSFIISSILIYYRDKIYYSISRFKSNIYISKHKNEDSQINLENHIIVVGYRRTGYGLVNKLLNYYKNILVIDFNPQIETLLKKLELKYIIGDIFDDETLKIVNFEKARLVISTITSNEENNYLIFKSKLYKIPIIVTSNDLYDALEFYHKGADLVIIPKIIAGEKIGELIEIILKNDINHKITELREENIKEINERIKLGYN